MAVPLFRPISVDPGRFTASARLGHEAGQTLKDRAVARILEVQPYGLCDDAACQRAIEQFHTSWGHDLHQAVDRYLSLYAGLEKTVVSYRRADDSAMRP